MSTGTIILSVLIVVFTFWFNKRFWFPTARTTRPTPATTQPNTKAERGWFWLFLGGIILTTALILGVPYAKNWLKERHHRSTKEKGSSHQRPEYPPSGSGVATKAVPLKCWLDPGRTYVRPMRSSTDETPAPAQYVLVGNPAEYFDDVGPGLNQNHRAWEKMPAGQYLVYPLRDDEIYFRWWK